MYEGLCFNHNSVKILRNIQETSVDRLIESSDWVLPSGQKVQKEVDIRLKILRPLLHGLVATRLPQLVPSRQLATPRLQPRSQVFDMNFGAAAELGLFFDRKTFCLTMTGHFLLDSESNLLNQCCLCEQQ